MTTCTCPTCDQPIKVTGLFISKDKRVAAFGDQFVKLAPTEGEILYILRSGASIAGIDICNRIERKVQAKSKKHKWLNNWIFHLRVRLELLGLRIIATGEGYRLMFPRA